MSVMIILPHSHYDIEHLQTVKAEMERLGAPKIKVVDCGDNYVALEGAHRLRAALELDIVPRLDVIKYEPELETDDIVPDSYQDNWTLEQIVSRAHTSTPLYFSDVVICEQYENGVFADEAASTGFTNH